MQKKYWLLFWLGAAALLFFSNGSLQITDSVESNYALTAKEMVLSGDWISPQIYGHYWYDKPIMFYWLTALAFKIFGFTEFAARLFPSIFGLAGLGLVCWGGSKLYGSRSGFYSGIVLLTCMEFFLISKSVITDAVLFLFFSGTLLFFYLGYQEGRKSYWYIMYACAALSTLTKGPVGFLLPGLIITLFLLWQNDWRVLMRMCLPTGIAVFLLIALPWYGAMCYLHGAEFINTFFGTHNFLRATVSEHPRDNVIYYYTAVNLLAFFPWSLLLPVIIYRKYKQGNLCLKQQEKFLLLWMSVVFIFFQCMATKYITYTYPILFPGALLLGNYLEQQEEVLSNKLFLTLMLGLFFGLTITAFWAAKTGLVTGKMMFLLPFSLIFGLLLHFALQYYGKRIIYSISIMSVAFYLALIGCIAVPFSQQRSAKDLGLMLPQITEAESIGVYGNYPTSAVFYSGKRIVKLMPAKEIVGFSPQAYSWSSKNVMPYAAVEQENYPFVIVGRKRLQNFQKISPVAWSRKVTLDDWIILQTADKAG